MVGKNSTGWTKREFTELDDRQIRNSNSIHTNLKQINCAVASRSSKALANISPAKYFEFLRTADTLLARSYLDLICEIERRLENIRHMWVSPAGKLDNLKPAGPRAHLSVLRSRTFVRAHKTEGINWTWGKREDKRGALRFGRMYPTGERRCTVATIRKLVDCSVRLRCPTRNEPF